MKARMKANIITKEVMDKVYEKDGWLYWNVKISGRKKDSLAGGLHPSGYYCVRLIPLQINSRKRNNKGRAISITKIYTK